MLAARRQGTLSELWAAAAARVGAPGRRPSRKVLAAGRRLAEGRRRPRRLRRDAAGALPHAGVAARAGAQGRAHSARSSTRWCASSPTSCARRSSHSAAGQQPRRCAAAIGAGARRRLRFRRHVEARRSRRAPKDELPPARRRRIEWALDVLSAAAFLRRSRGRRRRGVAPFDFAFDNCAGRHRRLPRRACRALAAAGQGDRHRRARSRRRATSRPTTTRSSSATTRTR